MPPKIVSMPLAMVQFNPVGDPADLAGIPATWEAWCVANGITDARDQRIGSVLLPRLFASDYEVARQAMAKKPVSERRDPLCVTVWCNSEFQGCPELIKHLIDVTKRFEDTDSLDESDERAYLEYIEVSARLRRENDTRQGLRLLRGYAATLAETESQSDQA